MTSTTLNQDNWTLIEKVLFRFSFVFFPLFTIFNSNGALFFLPLIAYFPELLLKKFVPFFGNTILGFKEPIEKIATGSGDTSYNFSLLALLAIVACVSAVVWTILDSKKSNYTKLLYWLTVLVRFYLGSMLINYGLVKVIKLQFPFPDLFRMMQPYGESSPMGLAWTFLGFSTGYNLFMGIAELLGALLYFRRTVAIGAFVALMTSLNIMAVNYFYDVPVKLMSTMMVVMCLYLLAPNIVRLFRFFFLGELIALKIPEAPRFEKEWQRNLKPVLKGLIILLPLFFAVTGFIYHGTGRKGYTKLPLYGAYKVEEFTWIDTAPADSMMPIKWDKLIIQSEKRSGIRFANDHLEAVEMKVDTVNKIIKITFRDEPFVSHDLAFQKSKEGLVLRGKIFNKNARLTLKKYKFELDRGFRWINEQPYNR